MAHFVFRIFINRLTREMYGVVKFRPISSSFVMTSFISFTVVFLFILSKSSAN